MPFLLVPNPNHQQNFHPRLGPTTPTASETSGLSHSLGQLRPNVAITTDNVVTFGAGYHGACSGEPTGCQAVPPQRAIGVGNFLGNSKSPTGLRL
jgi:hypothetical protein